MRTLALSTFVICSIALNGCGTTDHGRITSKIAAYESDAASYRAELSKTTDPVKRTRIYNSLIHLSRRELEIAKRINPETNPAYKSKSITLEQARKEKEERVTKIQGEMDELIKQRDADIAAHKS